MNKRILAYAVIILLAGYFYSDYAKASDDRSVASATASSKSQSASNSQNVFFHTAGDDFVIKCSGDGTGCRKIYIHDFIYKLDKQKAQKR